MNLFIHTLGQTTGSDAVIIDYYIYYYTQQAGAGLQITKGRGSKVKDQCSRYTQRIVLLLVAKLVLREITIAMLKLVVLVCLVALGAAQTPVKPKLPETFISQVRGACGQRDGVRAHCIGYSISISISVL